MISRLIFHSFILAIGIHSLFQATCEAEEIRLEFSAVREKKACLQRFYLDENKPAHLKKLPDQAEVLKFATVPFGGNEFCLAVAPFKDVSSRVWFDANGNGDFTDDPAVHWRTFGQTTDEDGKSRARYRVTATIDMSIGGTKLSAPREITLIEGDDKLLCVANYRYRGKVTLGVDSFEAHLSDMGTGDFSHPLAVLQIDLNKDGDFEGQSEELNFNTPFAYKGNTYEIRDVHPTGVYFRIVPSTAVAEEIRPAPILKQGQPFLPFESELLDGRKIKFPDDYKGKGKVVLLEFWATWCGPCVEKVPELKIAYDRFHDKGLEIVAVCLDKAEHKAAVEQFVKDKGILWPQVFDGKAFKSSIARAYDVLGIPMMLLVDPDTGLILSGKDFIRDNENLMKLLDSTLPKKK